MKEYKGSLVRIEHTVISKTVMANSEEEADKLLHKALNDENNPPDWSEGEVVHAEEFVQDVCLN